MFSFEIKNDCSLPLECFIHRKQEQKQPMNVKYWLLAFKLKWQIIIEIVNCNYRCTLLCLQCCARLYVELYTNWASGHTSVRLRAWKWFCYCFMLPLNISENPPKKNNNSLPPYIFVFIQLLLFSSYCSKSVESHLSQLCSIAFMIIFRDIKIFNQAQHKFIKYTYKIPYNLETCVVVTLDWFHCRLGCALNWNNNNKSVFTQRRRENESEEVGIKKRLTQTQTTATCKLEEYMEKTRSNPITVVKKSIRELRNKIEWFSSIMNK